MSIIGGFPAKKQNREQKNTATRSLLTSYSLMAQKSLENGSKVKTIKVKIGKKSVNKKYVKKYKMIFAKKNSGRKVTVKR